MALKALMLRKKIDAANKALAELRAKDESFATREAELTKAIEEAAAETASDEERAAVEEEVDSFEAEKKEHEEKAANLEAQIRELEEALQEEERAQDTDKKPEEDKPAEREMEVETMQKRGFFKNMNMETRSKIFEREDVKAFLGEVRDCIKNKRALTGVGNIIPEVFLGILRENMMEYSKLYKHVNVRSISGTGREAIQGVVTEAVWTECCANLNELDLPFYSVDIECWKVAGFYAVCNAVLEDSDVNLADILMDALAQAIGIAVDKAILFGLGTRMPLGIATRLAQTAAPTGYPATARPWADLHTSNVITISSANATGVKLFQSIVTAFGAAKGKYSRGEKVWVMNEATYTKLVAEAMSVNAAGAIASGVNGTMPVIGGAIEVLEFVPANTIIAGYFDLYLLGERAAARFVTSEHVRFLNDQTVFKGVARYDGQPAIAEGFVVIGVGGAPTTTVNFAADAANTSDAPTNTPG